MTGATLLDLLDLSADPARPAVVDATGVVTRAELLERASERASRVLGSVRGGAGVALHDTQDADAVIDVIAALLAGRSIAMVPQESGLDVARAAAVGCAAVLRRDRVEVIDLIEQVAPLFDTRWGEARVGSREAVVLFTSGTTSEPRGVRLSEANITANLTAMMHVAPPWRADDRFGAIRGRRR